MGFIDFIAASNGSYIITKMMHGDLTGYLDTVGSKGIRLPAVRVLLAQCLSALEYLHESKIIHYDIKPENLLIKHKSPLEVKLVDFGHA